MTFAGLINLNDRGDFHILNTHLLLFRLFIAIWAMDNDDAP